MRPIRSLSAAWTVCLVVAATGLLAWGSSLASAQQELRVRTVSSRADSVSGGDVVVAVHAPSAMSWTAVLNGRDVTQAFHPEATHHESLAYLDGLVLGKNVLEIQPAHGLKSRLEIVNHPLAGPVFSGPHQMPFLCQTELSGLGPALDADCSAKTVVRYYYKSTRPPQPGSGEKSSGLSPGFKAYDASAPLPDDMARTVTMEGRTVNYIVRWERGVINRGVYDIQFLHQPGEPLPTPWVRPAAGWNGRLIYTFGGGCAAGYRQGRFYPDTVGPEQELFLAQGYAIASSTLNILENTCNDRISAETVAMVKEHFIEQYGEPLHTIGWGASGGAIQQYLIAQNYPGLLDGLFLYLSIPDAARVAEGNVDWVLLGRAFAATTLPWTEAQKAAVSGLATWRLAEKVIGPQIKVSRANPRSCNPAVPGNPEQNVNEIRCDIYSNEINVLGRNPRTGLPYRPLDNVGVQYGLTAFNDGKIDAEQFVDLNERVGGYDEQDRFVGSRMNADPEAVRAAYETGFLMTGGGGLGDVPIIDWRWYVDDMLDGHDRVASFIARARLMKANGQADNQVVLVDPRVDTLYQMPQPLISPAVIRVRSLMQHLDRWLDEIAADQGPGTQAEKVVRNKPKTLSDGCWAIDGEQISEPATYKGPGRCNQLYPSHGNPRIAAGGPLVGIVKCQLKPIRAGDYARPLSEKQMARLEAVFPTGVCDYDREGVAEEVTRSTWQRF